MASEQSIFIENHDYVFKRFSRVMVNTYVLFRGLDVRGSRKLRTDTHIHTHTRDNYSNDNIKIIHSAEAHNNKYAISLDIKHMC